MVMQVTERDRPHEPTHPGMLRVIWRVVWPAIDHFVSDHGFVYAGYIAFTTVFALFPFLLFLLTVAGFLGQGEAAATSIELGLELLPPQVADVLRPVIDEVRNNASTGLLTFSAALTLWFASSGFESLRVAVNLAYDVEEHPSFFWSRLHSMLLTLFSAVIIIMAVLALVVGPFISHLVAFLSNGEAVEPDTFALLRHALGIGLLMSLTVILYLVLPKPRVRFWEVLPGALTAVVIWAVAAKAYSIYLTALGRYAVTYGSLAGVILTLFFFYISAIVFIFGAQLNGAIRRERLREAQAAKWAALSDAAEPE
ncbi:MAG TPA: YihY/virulence factor BrkB family protein [Geminicoccaceae bacterium]|nr:YihY/virulence factor BrkB family protein [Geminicoccaceae bacterium]